MPKDTKNKAIKKASDKKEKPDRKGKCEGCGSSSHMKKDCKKWSKDIEDENPLV